MNLTEYLNQLDPEKHPTVFVDPGELIFGNTIILGFNDKHTQIFFQPTGSILDGIEYVLINDDVIYTVDKDGNKKKPSVFRLKIKSEAEIKADKLIEQFGEKALEVAEEISVHHPHKTVSTFMDVDDLTQPYEAFKMVANDLFWFSVINIIKQKEVGRLMNLDNANMEKTKTQIIKANPISNRTHRYIRRLEKEAVLFEKNKTPFEQAVDWFKGYGFEDAIKKCEEYKNVTSIPKLQKYWHAVIVQLKKINKDQTKK